MLWIKYASIVLIVIAVNIIVKILLRKIFKIERVKKPFFSYNHINDLHKKIDWALRSISVIALIVVQTMVIIEGYTINLLLVALLISFGLDYVIRAFFEYTSSENPKQSILTISEGFLVVAAILIVIDTNLFNLGS